MRKLETFHILVVPNNIILEVTSTVAVAKKIGIRGGWIGKVLGEISTKRDHFTFASRISTTKGPT